MGQQAPLIRLSHGQQSLCRLCILPFLASRQPSAMRQPLRHRRPPQNSKNCAACLLSPRRLAEVLKRPCGQFAANTVSAQATKEVVEWLQKYGNARIQLNVDDAFSLKDSAFDFLYPWIDTKQHVLFSQTSLHRTDDRTQTNIGMGYRYFTAD